MLTEETFSLVNVITNSFFLPSHFANALAVIKCHCHRRRPSDTERTHQLSRRSISSRLSREVPIFQLYRFATFHHLADERKLMMKFVHLPVIHLSRVFASLPLFLLWWLHGFSDGQVYSSVNAAVVSETMGPCCVHHWPESGQVEFV